VHFSGIARFKNKFKRILGAEKTGLIMSEFALYFELGKEHILDSNGYDHILFVIALCTLYSIKQWKQVLILVTAFTLGHSVTLALATLEIITVDAELIEFLIPVTIFKEHFGQGREHCHAAPGV
jgi:hypothetical protein